MAIRYGDPSAPRFRTPWWVVTLAAVAIAFGLSAVIGSFIHAIATGVGIVGTMLGAAFFILILVGSVVAWGIYWRPMARTVRSLRRSQPHSLVIGARVPSNAGVLVADWPPQWAPVLFPGRVVVQFNGTGVALFAIRSGAQVMIRDWTELAGIEAVEYVEGRVAYEGAAIRGQSGGSALVLQLIEPSLIVRFPRGRHLANIVRLANEQRTGAARNS